MENESGLTKYLIEHNLTNRELAKKLGISETYLSMLRHGDAIGSVKLVKKICKILQMDQNTLFQDYKTKRRAIYVRKKKKPTSSQ